MAHESVLRALFAVIFGLMMAVSVRYRWRARRLVGAIPRRAEGAALILARAVVALPLLLLIVAYLIRPSWLAWSRIDIPVGLRYAAAVVGLLMIPVVVWVFRSLGSNVSETVLTREGQRLVSWGPYRWVRHPLYTTASVILAALSLVAANGAMALLTALVMIGVPFIARREESQLLARFGPDYVAYMERTGRFLPRVRGRS